MNSLLNIIRKMSFVVCLLSITMLSLSPSDAVPQVGGYDKIVHCLSYLFLSFCFWAGFQKARPVWLMLVLLVLFGVLIEVFQSFVPGRLMSFWDSVANGLGVLIGYVLFRFIKKLNLGVLK